MKVELVLFMLYVCGAVYGFPNGPPDQEGVCNDMTPNHIGTNPQETEPPFTVTPSSFTYTQGQEIMGKYKNL